MKNTILIAISFLCLLSCKQKASNSDVIIRTESKNTYDKMTELKSNKELYTSFNKFYTDSIRRETKDEWGGPYYHKIDQINGVHYLDFNNDNSDDALVEFSVSMSDGGTAYYLTAVLFENKNGRYKYVAYIEPNHTIFEKLENSVFYFEGLRYKALLDDDRSEQFKLINNKLVIIDSK